MVMIKNNGIKFKKHGFFNIKTAFIIVLAAIVCTTAFIFSNSLENSETSNNKSDKVAAATEPAVNSVTQNLSGKKIPQDKYREYVRKAAHFSEFMLLGALYTIFMLLIEKAFTKLLFMPLFFSLLTACTDEFIQNYTGRTSLLKDVFIDFGGACAGVLVVFVVFTALKRRRQKYKLRF